MLFASKSNAVAAAAEPPQAEISSKNVQLPEVRVDENRTTTSSGRTPALPSTISENLLEAKRQLDDLLAAPANNRQQELALDTSPANQQLDNVAGGPSLAELTAAGTVAGLVYNDLMQAQANAPQQYETANSEDREEPDRDEDPDLDLRDDQERGSSRAANQFSKSASPSFGPEVLEQQGNNHLLHQPSVSHQQQQEQPQLNIDQMPDSMESLMRSEGEGLDVDEGAAETAADDAQTQSQPAGSNLINQQPVKVGATTNHNDDDDDADADDDAGDGDNVEQVGQQQLRQVHQDEPSVLMSQHYANHLEQPLNLNPNQLAQGDIEHQMLVAPMRDSLMDLNASAGHYYGKKKKKKVKKVKKKKKIIIKKKKKKKKYKKVKIVKKYKKKKKPKKMMHHDHGKYYMYAKVPKKKSWEFGFKKGNKKHWIERHEKGHKNKFKTKVKWYDKKSKGKGLHIWDYNHHDKKKKKKHHY